MFFNGMYLINSFSDYNCMKYLLIFKKCYQELSDVSFVAEKLIMSHLSLFR